MAPTNLTINPGAVVLVGNDEQTLEALAVTGDQVVILDVDNTPATFADAQANCVNAVLRSEREQQEKQEKARQEQIAAFRTQGQRSQMGILASYGAAALAVSMFDTPAPPAHSMQPRGRIANGRGLPSRIVGTANQPLVKCGRNSPCPCLSGKKFKRCCGASGMVVATAKAD
jgi:hypothetical protein